MNDAKYDKRIVERDGKPDGYESHIESLVCCACGALSGCNCTADDFKGRKSRRGEN